MNKVYLLLGSNLSDPSLQLQIARAKILKVAEIVTQSSIYQTEAWGKTDQPDFLNQVILITTELNAEALLDEMLTIEKSMGRARTEKNSPRVIDIDILFYDSMVIDKKNLTVPHPHLAARRFVLIPLNEIAPDFSHPVYSLTVAQLLSKCRDPLQVKRY